MAAKTTTRSRCDPCGIVCVICIYLIIIYTDYAFIKWIVLASKASLLVITVSIAIFQMILILLVWSHFKASTSDPGIVPQPNPNLNPYLSSKARLLDHKKDDNDHNWSVCVRCEMYRPPRAHHCRICQRCIRKMDHHCPWINNCVGEMNQKYFILFLVYTGTACLYVLMSIIISFIKLKLDSHQRMIHTSVLLIEALLFGLFVVAVLTDQIQAVFANETTIDRYLQSKTGATTETKTRIKPSKLLKELCGPGPMIWWLLPCDRSDRFKNSSHFIV